MAFSTPPHGAEAGLVNSSSHARLTIDVTETAQVIEGFGASGAWWAKPIGAWPKEKRAPIIGLLFGTRGIGLTLYRYNIGAGSGSDIPDPWRRVESFEVSPGRYDWSRDADAVRILREACHQGVERVTLFSNSPPIHMTKSGHAFARSGTGQSNLRGDKQAAYAAYLADIAVYLKTQGIPVYSVSPINEPQWPWDQNHQEGCHYEPLEATALVELVLREFRRRKLDVRVEAPESGRWEPLTDILGQYPHGSPVYVDALFANPYIDKNLSSYALHSYRTNAREKKAFAEYFFGMYPGKKLHMSEWCELKGGRDYGMDSALTLARVMIEDFVLGGVSSWQYWIAVSKYDWHDGLIYVNESDQTYQTTKRLWAMGNFSKFIRPGFRRVRAHCDAPSVRVLAARDTAGENLVVVVSNSGNLGVSARLSLDGLAQALQYDVWETSSRQDLTRIACDQGGTQRVFPGQSITTLVFQAPIALSGSMQGH